jgi:hypothetical protein
MKITLLCIPASGRGHSNHPPLIFFFSFLFALYIIFFPPLATTVAYPILGSLYVFFQNPCAPLHLHRTPPRLYYTIRNRLPN